MSEQGVNNTIVTIGDINYLWGIFLLIASARKAGMKEPFLVGCKRFTPRARQVLEGLGNVSFANLDDTTRSLTCYKPFTMLQAKTEFVTWADSDAFFTGNVSEILALAAGGTSTRGVDASVADAVTDANLSAKAAFAKSFAAETGSVIAITGAIDLVADAARCYAVRNGTPRMGTITGSGCQLSGMMTAFVTANPETKLKAAAAAVAAMGLAGEIGWSRMQAGDGNSTYRNRIIDAIYNMDKETLDQGARFEIR